MKPTRQFSANEGDYSIGLSGPDAIENDIDDVMKMFDPLINHIGGEQGGIGTENIQANAITDDLVGDRTINDSTADAFTNTGKIGKLLSLIAKAIKAIKGTTTWFEAPADTIKNIHTRVNTNATNVGNLSTSKADKTYVDTELGKKADKTSVTASVSNLQSQISSNDSDITNLQNRDTTIDNKIIGHINNGNHDNLYYRKSEISKYIEGGEFVPKEETFTIVNNNLGNGTFTYKDKLSTYTGTISPEGYLIFTLKKGKYTMNNSSLVVWIQDYLRRTQTSGGIVELSETTFALKDVEDNGTEITVEYYHRIGLLGEHNIILSDQKPPMLENSIWGQIVEVVIEE